jgi:hypothetical protein
MEVIGNGIMGMFQDFASYAAQMQIGCTIQSRIRGQFHEL